MMGVKVSSLKFTMIYRKKTNHPVDFFDPEFMPVSSNTKHFVIKKLNPSKLAINTPRV